MKKLLFAAAFAVAGITGTVSAKNTVTTPSEETTVEISFLEDKECVTTTTTTTTTSGGTTTTTTTTTTTCGGGCGC